MLCWGDGGVICPTPYAGTGEPDCVGAAHLRPRPVMLLYILLIIAFVILTLVVIASRFGLIERLRVRWEAELESQESREAIGQLRGMARSEASGCMLYAALVPAIKLIWQWRTAPEGSVQKLVWTVSVTAAVAIGAWLVIHVIDNRINRAPRPLPDYEHVEEEQWETVDLAPETGWRSV